MGPEFYGWFRLPEFPDTRHMKVVRLSALFNGHLYLPGKLSIPKSVRS
jgi:hypothetical protein